MRYPEILSIEPASRRVVYDDQFTMLYALGVGCGGQASDLPFVYEKGLKALPTMASLFAAGAGDFIAKGDINFAMIVHGEQRLTLHRPLPPTGEMISSARCLSIIDKGKEKGGLLNVESTISDIDGMAVATSIATLFCRGDGGFGGPSEGELQLRTPPSRPPDIEIVSPTAPQQAALYRLLGDRNPLHIDPEAAAKAGFERPILHGLCTYAIACRAVMEACCDNEPSRIESFDVRFSAPVYPGESVTTRIWRDRDCISFECVIDERQCVAIRNGQCRLRA